MQGEEVVATVAGTVDRVSKLISVKPLKSRYTGEIGDVVVGRISELGQKRWKVDIKARQDAVLLLSSINLPGGVQAEVQQFFEYGAASLHTRSTKYRKLKNGLLVIVPSVLVKRSKSHFITLSCGVEVILGLNGYIWVSKNVPLPSALDNQLEGIYSNENDPISKEDRECISRVANVIQALATVQSPIHESIVAYAFESSLKHPAKDLLNSDIQKSVIEQALFHIKQQTSE